MRKNIALIYFIIFISVIVIGTVCVRRYFSQPLPQAQVILMTTKGVVASTEFSLPRGSYIVKAVLAGEHLDDDTSRKIAYKVDIPDEGLNLSGTAEINFRNKVSEIWLKSFEIRGNSGRGILNARVITTSGPAIKVKILAIKKVLFRTVE